LVVFLDRFGFALRFAALNSLWRNFFGSKRFGFGTISMAIDWVGRSNYLIFFTGLVRAEECAKMDYWS